MTGACTSSKGAGGQREAVVQDHIGAGGQDDSDDTGLDSLQERLHIGIVEQCVHCSHHQQDDQKCRKHHSQGGQGMRLQVPALALMGGKVYHDRAWSALTNSDHVCEVSSSSQP